MSPPKNPQAKSEFREECKRLLASVAIKACHSQPIDRKIMIHHGIAELFADGSPEQEKARETAWALASAEKRQLLLINLLEEAELTSTTENQSQLNQ